MPSLCVNNPDGKKADFYFVNSYGSLDSFNPKRYMDLKGKTWESVWLSTEEIKEILKSPNKEEKYRKCNELFKKKFPQSNDKKRAIAKEEESNLEKLFN